mmetsp:Transcript_5125/g.13774  ORF Transcript_5125/g.13774 Transcript_5125/m.13774 type:complete len:190 (+) Transcript_5125:396-965(+)
MSGVPDADVEGVAGADDERWMRMALTEAERALSRGEVPVGCVIVGRNAQAGGELVVLGRGSNRCTERKNGTWHAELVALRDAARALGGATALRLALQDKDAVLYVTCEPCIMCTGALQLTGIRRVVYGCSNDRFGGCGSVRSDHEAAGFVSIRAGVLADEGMSFLQHFYTQRNPSAPHPKVKRLRSNTA